MQHFDLCVIGSGPAGRRAAIQAAKLGRRVCVVEKRQVVGGEAVSAGTIPSKALREAIVSLHGAPPAMPRIADFNAARNEVFANLQHSVQRVIQHEITLVRDSFQRNGVEVVYSAARFIESNKVEVVGPSVETTVSADKFLIAVGSTPARPANIPFDERTVVTSDEMFRLGFLPVSLIVVGGGVIGTEYASMLTALGVKVTLIDARDELLGFVDHEIAEALQYHLRQAGMTLRMGEKVMKVDTIDPPQLARAADGRMVEATLESGKTLRADCLLYAIGRQGATGELGLEAVGIQPDKRGRIEVDEHFQTSVPHVYAAGDVVGFPALASTSMEQGRAAACHMFDRPSPQPSELLPYGIYSVPEISMVGWTEEQLTKDGIPYESGVAQYREIARGQLLGDEIGMLKMLIHQESRTVLGVHAIGTGATELIHIGQAAMAFKATVDYFVDAVFNYPTLAECYKVAALNGVNKLMNV